MGDIKKIIIFGFPHCGTSILRSIIGHSEDVYEVLFEVNTVKQEHIDTAKKLGKRYVLIKWPFFINYKSNTYTDYIKIFIIRNPLYVFSSLNRRFEFNIPQCHSFKRYVNVAKVFLEEEAKGEQDKLYCIRYENMFRNNYKLLRDIFDKIGFYYDDTLFDNSVYTNQILKNIPADIKEVPKYKNHGQFRTWQINQPFKNMNLRKKLELTKDQMLTIYEDPIVRRFGYSI